MAGSWGGTLGLERPLGAFVNPQRRRDGLLTAQQLAQYKHDGYLTIENVFSAAELATLQSVTDEFVERSRSVASPTDVFDLEPWHTPESPALRRIKNPVANHEVYHRAFCNDFVLGVVETLLGTPNIRTNGDKLNLKLPGVGSPVQWHQDWGYYPHTNDDLLAVGIALDDMTIANGAMQV